LMHIYAQRSEVRSEPLPQQEWQFDITRIQQQDSKSIAHAIAE